MQILRPFPELTESEALAGVESSNPVTTNPPGHPDPPSNLSIWSFLRFQWLILCHRQPPTPAPFSESHSLALSSPLVISHGGALVGQSSGSEIRVLGSSFSPIPEQQGDLIQVT